MTTVISSHSRPIAAGSTLPPPTTTLASAAVSATAAPSVSAAQAKARTSGDHPPTGTAVSSSAATQGGAPFAQAPTAGANAVVTTIRPPNDNNRRRRRPTSRDSYVVWVNVYDITWMNDALVPLGMGIHHTAIEVHGVEYGFGRCASGPGTFRIPPRSFPVHEFRESIALGTTTFAPAEVEAIVERMSETWRGPSYHLLRRNCNHFSEAFSNELLRGTRCVDGAHHLVYAGDMALGRVAKLFWYSLVGRTLGVVSWFRCCGVDKEEEDDDDSIVALATPPAASASAGGAAANLRIPAMTEGGVSSATGLLSPRVDRAVMAPGPAAGSSSNAQEMNPISSEFSAAGAGAGAAVNPAGMPEEASTEGYGTGSGGNRLDSMFSPRSTSPFELKTTARSYMTTDAATDAVGAAAGASATTVVVESAPASRVENPLPPTVLLNGSSASVLIGASPGGRAFQQQHQDSSLAAAKGAGGGGACLFSPRGDAAADAADTARVIINGPSSDDDGLVDSHTPLARSRHSHPHTVHTNHHHHHHGNANLAVAGVLQAPTPQLGAIAARYIQETADLMVRDPLNQRADFPPWINRAARSGVLLLPRCLVRGLDNTDGASGGTGAVPTATTAAGGVSASIAAISRSPARAVAAASASVGAASASKASAVSSSAAAVSVVPMGSQLQQTPPAAAVSAVTTAAGSATVPPAIAGAGATTTLTTETMKPVHQSTTVTDPTKRPLQPQKQQRSVTATSISSVKSAAAAVSTVAASTAGGAVITTTAGGANNGNAPAVGNTAAASVIARIAPPQTSAGGSTPTSVAATTAALAVGWGGTLQPAGKSTGAASAETARGLSTAAAPTTTNAGGPLTSASLTAAPATGAVLVALLDATAASVDVADLLGDTRSSSTTLRTPALLGQEVDDPTPVLLQRAAAAGHGRGNPVPLTAMLSQL